MSKWITVDEGGGYKTRARRIDTDAYSIIVVEWQHPNYGYWADAGVFISSLHSPEWSKRPDVDWFNRLSPAGFVMEYPQFRWLFDGSPQDRLFDRIRRKAREGCERLKFCIH